MSESGVAPTGVDQAGLYGDLETILRGYIAGISRMLDPDFVAPEPMITEVLLSAAAVMRVVQPLLPEGGVTAPTGHLELLSPLPAQSVAGRGSRASRAA